MTHKILVSRGLPTVAQDLIPNDIDVDYKGFERALLPLNIVLAPHVASASSATRVAMATLAVRHCPAVLDGQPALTPVTA